MSPAVKAQNKRGFGINYTFGSHLFAFSCKYVVRLFLCLVSAVCVWGGIGYGHQRWGVCVCVCCSLRLSLTAYTVVHTRVCVFAALVLGRAA